MGDSEKGGIQQLPSLIKGKIVFSMLKASVLNQRIMA